MVRGSLYSGWPGGLRRDHRLDPLADVTWRGLLLLALAEPDGDRWPLDLRAEGVQLDEPGRVALRILAPRRSEMTAPRLRLLHRCTTGTRYGATADGLGYLRARHLPHPSLWPRPCRDWLAWRMAATGSTAREVAEALDLTERGARYAVERGRAVLDFR